MTSQLITTKTTLLSHKSVIPRSTTKSTVKQRGKLERKQMHNAPNHIKNNKQKRNILDIPQ